MKKVTFIYCVIFFILIFVLLANNVSAQRALEYTLNPVFNGSEMRFRIDLKFKGDESGTTKLVLPNQWGGQPNLYQTVRQLQVVSPNAKLSDTNEPFVKIITHRVNEMLHIQYELAQDFAGSPKGDGGSTHYRPLLQKDYFHWIGHGVWIYPQWNETETVRVSLAWKNLPKSWTLADSFGTDQKRQKLQTTIEDFTHAVFVGGDFRVKTVLIGGNPVNIALRGSWKFSDEAFYDLVQRVIKTERDFWQDYDAPYYLITLIPLEGTPNNVTTAGTGLTNSFAAFATPNSELDRFKHLLAHEYFHNWNSPRLGRLKEPAALLFWFSEGFTDYYTYLLLLRGGLISLDEYLKTYNRLIREYYLSPVRAADNSRVLKDFWNDGRIGDLPYRRGLLLATNWNAQIRSASGGKNSLDDAMREMFNFARRNRPEITSELVNENISRYTKRSVLPDIQKYIENGELIAPDKDAFGPHVRMEITEVSLFELGLDLESLRTKKIIAGVEEGSAAFQAGLRNGQIVVKRSAIYPGDATKQIEITIKDSEGEIAIKYYPASRNTVSVPEYKMRPDISDSERNEILWLLGVNQFYFGAANPTKGNETLRLLGINSLK